jgi:hypothetical protein
MAGMAARPTSADVAGRLLRLVGRVVADQFRARPDRLPRRAGPRRGRARGRAGSSGDGGYPGDYRGRVEDLRIDYAPRADGDADAGEVVWAWVPYEEDHRRGKDRPVLVLGRDGAWLAALMLTSRDHDGDTTVEVRTDRAGRRWMDLGAGPWDPQGRPSEVRLDRVLRLDPATVRREGAALDRSLFDRVVQAAKSP